MQNEKSEPSPQQTDAPESPDSPSAGKKPWQEPKLAFVEPKLTQHGRLKSQDPKPIIWTKSADQFLKPCGVAVNTQY